MIVRLRVVHFVCSYFIGKLKHADIDAFSNLNTVQSLLVEHVEGQLKCTIVMKVHVLCSMNSYHYEHETMNYVAISTVQNIVRLPDYINNKWI